MSDYGARFVSGFSLHEALSMIEDEDFQRSINDVVILPLEDGADTDEDSGEEDNMTPDNLPSGQLRAPAEIVLQANEPETHILDDEYDSEDNIPLARFNHSEKSSHKVHKSYHWTNGHLDYSLQEVLSVGQRNNQGDEEEASPIDYFMKFFDQSLFNFLTEESNRYANKNNKSSKCITVQEMKAFVGILILSGYVPYPRRKMFWEKDRDTHNKLVADALSRDRFDYIMSVFHMADNDNLDNGDKFAKARPLFKALNVNFLEYAKFEYAHSVDEAMVPYFGRHGCKQFIKGKPIRWGYKFWVGCTSKGYINWFEPYQGASTHISPQYKDISVGAGVVLTYVDALRSRWSENEFHLFFDNFFTNLSLFEHLSGRGVKGTGTIRSNRIPKNRLKTLQEMKKCVRGSYDYKTEVDKRLTILAWHDNNIVSFCSNGAGVNPIRMVKRYSLKEKKTILVSQPSMIKLYNQNMGGVDRCDQNISLYRTGIRGKKWYFCLFAQCIDMAIQNAWQLHRNDRGTLDHLAFRRRIATSILESNARGKILSVGRPSKRENIDSRFDGLHHYIIPQDKQTRCRYCHMKTTTKCQKCDVGVHVKCFVNYHTNSSA